MTGLTVIYTRHRSLSSVAIRAAAWWGPWSHCGIVDGEAVIESLARRGGVVQSLLVDVIARASAHTIVQIPCPRPERGIEWARSTIGQPYDWGGVLAIPFRNRQWDEPGRWYCSEHVEAAAKKAGAGRWRDGLHGLTPCASYFNRG
jgi:uncharacterized protein YycO